MNAPEEPPNDEDDRGRNNIFVAVAIIVLLAIAWFVIQKMVSYQQMENCRVEGRRDCDPVAIPDPS